MSDTIQSSNDKISVKGLGKTIGASGTAIMSGIITGEEYNRQLTGKFALRQFEIMRRSDSSAEGALDIIKQPILNVERSVKAVNDDEDEQYKARFINRELFSRNIDFQQFMEEQLTFLDFGYSVAEFTLELTEFEGKTRIGIKELGFRKQISIERWETTDKKPGITQLLTTTENGQSNTRSIPMEKLLIFTNKKEGQNYEGTSLLRFAYKDWDMKDKLGLVHAIGLEKMVIPTPTLTTPANVNPSDEASAEESLRQYRANEEAYIKIPQGWTLDKFDMSGQSLEEVLPALQYYDRQIFVSVLAAFMSLGSSDASGSKAVGQVQYKPYVQKVATVNRRFQAPIQKFINFLCDINFSDNSQGYPELVSGRFEDDDIAALAQAAKNLSDAGLITPDPELEQHLRDIMHFPDLPDDIREDYKNRNQPSNKDNIDPTDEKDLEKQQQKKTSAAIKSARKAQQGLIDVILG